MIIKNVASDLLIDKVREIFREYQQSQDIDLCFHNFEEELSGLPGKYAPPQGRLYLAFWDGSVAGCVALCPLTNDRCELKRLYVRPQYRRLSLGFQLATKIIEDAEYIGYSQIVLHTLPTMTAAHALYRSLGFREIELYCDNSVLGAKGMYLNL